MSLHIGDIAPNFTIATPANWPVGDEVIILPSIPDEMAKEMFPRGFKTIKPYLRTTKVA